MGPNLMIEVDGHYWELQNTVDVPYYGFAQLKNLCEASIQIWFHLGRPLPRIEFPIPKPIESFNYKEAPFKTKIERLDFKYLGEYKKPKSQ